MRGLQALLLIAAPLLPSCAATSYRYHFQPSPAEVQVFAAEDGPEVARVHVGVLGAERKGERRDGHPLLVTRVRVEARGPGPVTLDPSEARVLGPDLAEFGAALVDPPGVLEVPAGESRDVTLRFPFPLDGDLRMPRLTGVNVNLPLDTPAGPRDVSVTLERNEYERVIDRYYDDYPPHWRYRFGFHYYGC